MENTIKVNPNGDSSGTGSSTLMEQPQQDFKIEAHWICVKQELELDEAPEDRNIGDGEIDEAHEILGVKHEAVQIKRECAQSYDMAKGLAKTIVMFRNRIQIGKMLDKLETKPFTIDLDRGGNEEKQFNEECVRVTTTQKMVYWVLCYTTVYGLVVYSIVRRIIIKDPTKWEMPFGPLTVLNITYSPNFEMTWFYQSLSIISVCAHFTSGDIVMSAVLAHISYQFKMLQNCLRRLASNCYKDVRKNSRDYGTLTPSDEIDDIDVSTIPWRYLHKQLKYVVNYHLAIASLAREMENVFSELLLSIFLGTLGLICFSIYRAAVEAASTKTLLHMGVTFSSCAQVLISCYWGEQVVFESQQVGKAVYESNFVGADLRYQKGLLVIICRSQRPVKLTAAKFADICLSTFTWIMRTSYSAFMVVKGRS